MVHQTVIQTVLLLQWEGIKGPPKISPGGKIVQHLKNGVALKTPNIAQCHNSGLYVLHCRPYSKTYAVQKVRLRGPWF